MIKVVEEDDTLAAKATSKEDQYRTGLEGFSEFGGLDGFPDLKGVDVSLYPQYVLVVSFLWRSYSRMDNPRIKRSIMGSRRQCGRPLLHLPEQAKASIN